jgi:hypothetical protein
MYRINSAVAKRAAITDDAKADRTAKAVVLTGMALVALFVGLRVYSRLITARSWGLDDCKLFPLSSMPSFVLASRQAHDPFYCTSIAVLNLPSSFDTSSSIVG